MTAARPPGIELRWPGKYDAEGRRAAIPRPGLSLRTDASYPRDPDATTLGEGRLIQGDNLAVMDALLETHAGAVDLLYIDPPFATGGDFSAALPVGDGEGLVRARAYSDRWDGGVGGFLEFLDPRLRLCHQLLAETGSLYVHLDATVVHPVKLMLDEIFGAECFQREIVWRIGWISGFKSRARNWIRNHDTILFYTRDPSRFTFHKAYVEYPPEYRRRDGKPPRGRGIPIDDVWNAGAGDLQLRGADSLDSIQIKSFSREKTGWATQKNESLCRRIIAASSNPGDLVADFFCGSGTTLAAAAALGRRFLGCDRSPLAIHLARRRLRARGVGLTMERVAAEVAPPSRRVLEDRLEVRDEHAIVDGVFLAEAAQEAVRAGCATLRVIGARFSLASVATTPVEQLRATGAFADGVAPIGAIADGEAGLEAPTDGAATIGAIADGEAGLEAPTDGAATIGAIADGEGGLEVTTDGAAPIETIADEAGIATRTGGAPAALERLAIELAHARGDEPPIERPRVRLTWATHAPWSVAVTLHDYTFDRPEALPGVVIGDAGARHFVDAWSIAVGDADEPEAPVYTPTVERLRDPRSRALAGEAVLEAPSPRTRAVVQLLDVFGHETRWSFTLIFEGDGALMAVLEGIEAVVS